MTPERLAEIEARAEAATAGPWEVHDSCSWRRIGTPGRDGNILCPTNHPIDHHVDLSCAEEDLDFIAHARTDIPDLIAEVKRLRAELEELEAEDEYTRCAVLPAVAIGVTESSIGTIVGGNQG